MALTRSLLVVTSLTLGLAMACREQPAAGPAPTPVPAPAVAPVPVPTVTRLLAPVPPATALPVATWQLQPGRPDATVTVDGDGIVVCRGPLGVEQFLSRAYLDLPVQPGGQYLFNFTAQCDGHGAGRVFCYVGDATSWDERHITTGPQISPGPAAPGILAVVVPTSKTRIRLCVAAEGPDVTARFSGLSLQAAIPPLTLTPSPAAVKLDGRLDDALWQATTPLSAMRVLGDIKRAASLATETRMAVQDGWLWIAVRCPEPDPGRIRITDKDAFGIFADDCIEVYVSQDQVEYSQVVVNAAGKRGWKRMNKAIAGRSWFPVADEGVPGTVESAAHIDREAKLWTCEMRLRISDIYGGSAPGGPTPLFLNVVRHRPQTSEPYVSWSLLPGKTNHDPSHFAAVTLELPARPATPAVAGATAAPAAPGRLALTSSLEVPEVLLGATPVRLATGGGRFALPTTLRITDRADIDPGVLADIQAAAQVADAGTVELTLAIAPAALDDPALDAAQRARLAGPEAFRLELAGARAAISGRTRLGVLRGLATLATMTERARISSRDLPDLVLLDAPASPVRGWLLHDNKPIAVTRQAIDVAFRLRLNHLVIGVDSFNGPTGFPFTSAPIGDPERTTQEWVDAFAYARARGIDPIPYISSWGRVQYITRLPQYRHLMVSDRGIDQPEHRNLDVANPESQRLMLALQQDLITALKPTALCIAFDEIHFGELVTSAAARAKRWKPSDWVVEALTVNADFLRRQGVRMWLWGDMIDPDQNGRQLDQSGPALLARLPKDMTILDWKYEGVFDGEADFASVGMFKHHGLPTLGSPWFKPGNVAAMATSVHRYAAEGMIQTSWCSTNPPNMKCELERALALTARLTWSPADTDLARLRALPEAPFAFARTRREAALGPARTQRPVAAPDGLTGEIETAKLLGWPGSSLDFLTSEVRNLRQIALRPFQRDGRPAAVASRPEQATAIALGGTVRTLTFLHASTPRRLTGEMHADMKLMGEDMGAYLVRYADGSNEHIPLAYRRNVAAINDPTLGHEQDPGIFGTLSGRHFVNLACHTWINPHPERVLSSVELVAGPSRDHTMLLFALTAE